MTWLESEGKPLAPIVKMQDGDELVALVIQLKKVEGQFEGWLVDCCSLKGTDFALTGHQMLVDKIRQQLGSEPRLFAINCKGKVGRAVNYEVFGWTGEPHTWLREDGAEVKVEAAEEWLQMKLAEAVAV